MNALRLEQPPLLFQQRLPSLQFRSDGLDGLFYPWPRHDEVTLRIDGQAVEHAKLVTRERIK